MPVFAPTNTNSLAFLLKVWESRQQFSEHERRGFAQSFYIALCGHVESTIASRIDWRLREIEIFVTKSSVAPATFRMQEIVESFAIDPLINSLQGIIASIRKELKTAAASRLIELTRTVLSAKLQTTLSTSNYGAFQALIDLRNTFSHSRAIVFNVELGGQRILEGAALEKAIKILRARGIASPAKATDQSSEFDVLYGDSALMFFYSQVSEIEEKIGRLAKFGPDAFPDFFGPALPNIEA